MTATGAVSMSSASLQYLTVPVQVTKAGAPYNPTSDTVQFAFLTNAGSIPTSAQWVSGSWITMQNYNYPYAAQCLIGTGGGTALTTGKYVVWLKITDSPEIPVFIAGQLQIV